MTGIRSVKRSQPKKVEGEGSLQGPISALEIGIDEAGRGPLAGPVVAAAVILPVGATIVGLNDSKQLSDAKRERVALEIKATALCWGLGMAEAAEIDAINILEATFLAMRRALLSLSLRGSRVWIDGNRLPKLVDLIDPNTPVTCVIKGDASVASIAAASVLAKTWRDRYMRQMAERYPQYGFERHKGYGSAGHLKAIAMHGPCPLHRLSFKPLTVG